MTDRMMMTTRREWLREQKQILRAFMQQRHADGEYIYTDERLTWLLAHARSGRLHFNSCCCFIGIVTADHSLRAGFDGCGTSNHYTEARLLPGAVDAERAFNRLGLCQHDLREETQGRARLYRIIPMVLAEMRRRGRARQATVEAVGEYARA